MPVTEAEVAINIDADDIQASRTGLAQLLARAIENHQVRQLIKEEAAKQFDRDYDVLLTLVKDQPLASGETLFDYLVTLEGSEERVSQWLSDWKLATLYVPLLDHLSFSAEQWEVNTVVPPVALYLQDSVMNVYDQAGNATKQSVLEWPQQAMLVLKDWERGIIAPEAINGRQNQQLVVGQADGNVIALSDEAFMPETSSSSARKVHANEIDSKLKYAFHYYPTNQRDHVYYNLPDGPNTGQLNGGGYYEEALVGLKLDIFPKWPDGGWVEGNFEFHFLVFCLNGSASESIKKVVSIGMNDLFDTKTLTYKLWVPSRPINIQPWDLQTQGDTWLVQMLEYNPSSPLIQKTVSFETTVGTNFTTELVEIAPFVLVERTRKIGWHFNGTPIEKRVVIASYQTTESSSDMGQTLIRFNDKVINDQTSSTSYTIRTNKTSIKRPTSLYFSPIK